MRRYAVDDVGVGMTSDEILNALYDGGTLRGIDLSNASLEKRELWDCTIEDGRFDGIEAARLYAHAATFVRCSFRDADLSAAALRYCVFEQCDFTGARLAGASATEATFKGCRFDRADLSGTYLQDARFLGPVSDACFVGAQLLDTQFDHPVPDTVTTATDMLEPGTSMGPFIVESELAGAMSNARYAATTSIARPRHVLVTETARQRKPIEEVRPDMMYSVDGVASLVAVFEARSASRVRHVLVEERPRGAQLAGLGPLPEPEARALLLGLAEITMRAHTDGWKLWGIHPSLCFARADAGRRSITGIAPRAMRFLLGAPPARGGLCLEPYLPFDVWRDGNVEAADDVFALCGLGYFLVTGAHPFPGPTFDAQLAGVAQWRVPRLPGPFGDLLARGLVQEREQRITSAELAVALGAKMPARPEPAKPRAEDVQAAPEDPPRDNAPVRAARQDWVELRVTAAAQPPFTPQVATSILETLENNEWIPLRMMRESHDDEFRAYNADEARALLAAHPWIEVRGAEELGLTASITSIIGNNVVRAALMPGPYKSAGPVGVEAWIERVLRAFPAAELASANCDFDQLMFKRENGVDAMPLFGPEMGWLHVLPAWSYPRHYDRDVLLGAPAYRVTEQDDGSIWIWVYENPLGYDTPDARASHIALNHYLQRHVRR